MHPGNTKDLEAELIKTKEALNDALLSKTKCVKALEHLQVEFSDSRLQAKKAVNSLQTKYLQKVSEVEKLTAS